MLVSFLPTRHLQCHFLSLRLALVFYWKRLIVAFKVRGCQDIHLQKTLRIPFSILFVSGLLNTKSRWSFYFLTRPLSETRFLNVLFFACKRTTWWYHRISHRVTTIYMFIIVWTFQMSLNRCTQVIRPKSWVISSVNKFVHDNTFGQCQY